VQRICLIGAECTGKTSLAQALAQRLGGVVVTETLRDFCLRHGRTPYAHEQAGLMARQCQQEAQAITQLQPSRQKMAEPAFVFCDGAPLLTAVYSAHYFADRSLLEVALQHHAHYALTLWLQPDLPWQADGFMRDGPAAQTAVHALLEQVLADLPRVVRIQGTHHARIHRATEEILRLVEGYF